MVGCRPTAATRAALTRFVLSRKSQPQALPPGDLLTRREVDQHTSYSRKAERPMDSVLFIVVLGPLDGIAMLVLWGDRSWRV